MPGENLFLSINIPTYNRLESFFEIIGNLSSQIKRLNPSLLNSVAVAVFSNDDLEVATKKQLFLEKCFAGFSNISFKSNSSNIGADRNIIQCCAHDSGAEFTWVLGDDDHPVPFCIEKILQKLQTSSSDLGWFLLRDQVYQIHPLLLGHRNFTNFLTFAKMCSLVQPHMLIAYTLISINIFRTNIFDNSRALYVVDELTPRISLKANFCHMYGIINGLLVNKKLKVHISDFISLDTSRRINPKPQDEINWNEMKDIYYYYFMWLLTEIGVKINSLNPDHLQSVFLTGLFPKT